MLVAGLPLELGTHGFADFKWYNVGKAAYHACARLRCASPLEPVLCPPRHIDFNMTNSIVLKCLCTCRPNCSYHQEDWAPMSRPTPAPGMKQCIEGDGQMRIPPSKTMTVMDCV